MPRRQKEPKNVPNRAVSSRFFLALFGLAAMLFPACNREEVDFGSGQRASQAEIQEQNRNLLAQVVTAAEEMERHPDPAYLQNSLARLNSWLEGHAGSKDFAPSEEYAAVSAAFGELRDQTRRVGELVNRMTAEGAAPDEKTGEELLADLESLKKSFGDLAEKFGSSLFSSCAAIYGDLADKVSGAKAYQFGDKGKMMQTAVVGFQFPAELAPTPLSDRLDSLVRLYTLNSRTFLPEDAYQLMEAVWLRNVSNWAKGDRQDDLAIAQNLFDWTCETVALLPSSIPSQMGPIRQNPWQTILTSQGTALDRAAVFMELLRQNRIDGFLILPHGAAKEKSATFPILVGAVLDGKIRLFLPGLGLPIPGPEGLKISADGKKKGLAFHSIASLDEAAADDAMLRRLDLSADEQFPLTAADLKEVDLILPTNAMNLSERMRIMEQEFSSNIHTVLADSFTGQKERIASLSPNIKEIKQGWALQTPTIEQTLLPSIALPILTPYLYSMQFGDDLSPEAQQGKQDVAPEEIKNEKDRVSPLRDGAANFNPLWGGKILYFAGRFTGENGAAYWLQQGKVSDRLIKQAAGQINANLLQFMTQVQKQRAAEGTSLSEEETRLLAMQYVQQEQHDIFLKVFLKTAARFYLALISRAIGNDSTALTHLTAELQENALTSEIGAIWHTPSLSLLAKIHEEQGEYVQAIPVYRSMKGPLCYGPRLRGKWLADLTAPAPKAEEPKAEEPKAEEPKAEEPKAEEPKAEEPKAEEPKAEEPKVEEPKAEEPKE